MDYLTYAYLQRSRIGDAAREVKALKAMKLPPGTGFKVGYAGNAMPVRLAVETRDWATASQLTPIAGSGPQVAAVVWWARVLGRLRAATPGSADADIAGLAACREALRAANDNYWMAQTDALLKSAQAWRFAATGDVAAAVATMTAAADEEDGLEKLPLTPGRSSRRASSWATFTSSSASPGKRWPPMIPHWRWRRAGSVHCAAKPRLGAESEPCALKGQVHMLHPGAVKGCRR